MRYKDRQAGGITLAEHLKRKYGGQGVVVFGLPRGGVVTASAVAQRLGAELDVVVTRKIGHPHNPEYALGAIAEGGFQVINQEEIEDIPIDWLKEETEFQLLIIEEQLSRYGHARQDKDLSGKAAILVDDGIATGYTMEAAILATKAKNPVKIVVATPVGAPRLADQFKDLADDVVVSYAPHLLFAVSQYYEDFHPVSDEEVVEILRLFRHPRQKQARFGIL